MASEQEQLFQLFHDLVDEALEQYAAGYAVNLEQRYYELADTLIADRNQQLEQQLAVAREELTTALQKLAQEREEKHQAALENERNFDVNKRLGESLRTSNQKLNQARALLMDWLPNEFSLRPGRAEALEKRTRAFLAQQKE